MNFYASAQDKNGKTVIIYPNNGLQHGFTDRLTATQEAERMAKQLELTDVDVRPTGRSEGRTMTKFFKHRKKNRGQNPREYNAAL